MPKRGGGFKGGDQQYIPWFERMVNELSEVKQILGRLGDHIKGLEGNITSLAGVVSSFIQYSHRKWDENDRRWQENDRRWRKRDRQIVILIKGLRDIARRIRRLERR